MAVTLTHVASDNNWGNTDSVIPSLTGDHVLIRGRLEARSCTGTGYSGDLYEEAWDVNVIELSPGLEVGDINQSPDGSFVAWFTSASGLNPESSHAPRLYSEDVDTGQKTQYSFPARWSHGRQYPDPA
jgi:hypothetical protein